MSAVRLSNPAPVPRQPTNQPLIIWRANKRYAALAAQHERTWCSLRAALVWDGFGRLHRLIVAGNWFRTFDCADPAGRWIPGLSSAPSGRPPDATNEGKWMTQPKLGGLRQVDDSTLAAALGSFGFRRDVSRRTSGAFWVTQHGRCCLLRRPSSKLEYLSNRRKNLLKNSRRLRNLPVLDFSDRYHRASDSYKSTEGIRISNLAKAQSVRPRSALSSACNNKPLSKITANRQGSESTSPDPPWK